MISIQSTMLVSLGFLGACLLALVVAPAFWARAVRLTTQRIKASMPVSDVEIRADKDRIRAEYAIKVHKLETQIEQVRLSAARQQIEINRRDASINELQGAMEQLTAAHEEALNARRVLEQTVADRLPRVELRLTDARKMLFTRDREIGELTRTSERQGKALAEASAINAQQQAEIERLNTALTTRAARNEAGLSDPRFDGEVALRAELEALRAKTRDQAQLLGRLQGMVSRGETTGAPSELAARASLAERSGPELVKSANGLDPALQADLERQVRSLKSRTDDQAGEIARLKAALAVFEGDTEGDAKGTLRESRIALKARMQSLEAQTTQQAETIQKLRSELAAANERLGRQAAHYTRELKRLGAGTLPASGQARRTAEPVRLSLAERVAQARANPAPSGASATVAVLKSAGEAGPAAAAGIDPSKASGDGSEKPGPADAEGPIERAGGDGARGRLAERIAGASGQT